MARSNSDVVAPGVANVLRKTCRSITQRTRAALLAAAAACSLIPAAPTASAGVLDPGDNFFPIGVWQQPTSSFSKWQQRGINTLMSVPQGHDTDAWAASAVSSGLYQVRQARPDPTLDINDPTLLAWMHPDEPDYRKVAPSTLASQYSAYKALDPQKPVLVNFSGGNLLQGTTPRSTYEEYMTSTDWVSNDIYPIAGWNRPEWIDYSRPAAQRLNPGAAVDRLRQWSGGKPQWAVIESSDQKLTWVTNPRGVTPAELRGQVWHSIIHGATGIVYFPLQIGGSFRFDTTPADVATEMTVQNQRIQALAGIINSSPSRTGLTLNFGSPLLEGTSRRFGGKEFYFVLNMSDTTLDDQAIALPTLGVPAVGVVGESRSLVPQSGLIFDDFQPFEMHVYEAGTKAYSIFDNPGAIVPEPAMLGGIALVGLLLRRRQRQQA